MHPVFLCGSKHPAHRTHCRVHVATQSLAGDEDAIHAACGSTGGGGSGSGSGSGVKRRGSRRSCNAMSCGSTTPGPVARGSRTVAGRLLHWRTRRVETDGCPSGVPMSIIDYGQRYTVMSAPFTPSISISRFVDVCRRLCQCSLRRGETRIWICRSRARRSRYFGGSRGRLRLAACVSPSCNAEQPCVLAGSPTAHLLLSHPSSPGLSFNRTRGKVASGARALHVTPSSAYICTGMHGERRP